MTPDPKSPTRPVINLGMAFNSWPNLEQSLVEKLTPGQVGKIIDQGGQEQANRHTREIEVIKAVQRIAGLAILAALAACWAFLHYGKAEVLKDIFLVLIGATGGFAGGRALPARRGDVTPPDA